MWTAGRAEQTQWRIGRRLVAGSQNVDTAGPVGGSPGRHGRAAVLWWPRCAPCHCRRGWRRAGGATRRSRRTRGRRSRSMTSSWWQRRRGRAIGRTTAWGARRWRGGGASGRGITVTCGTRSGPLGCLSRAPASACRSGCAETAEPDCPSRAACLSHCGLPGCDAVDVFASGGMHATHAAVLPRTIARASVDTRELVHPVLVDRVGHGSLPERSGWNASLPRWVRRVLTLACGGANPAQWLQVLGAGGFPEPSGREQ